MYGGKQRGETQRESTDILFPGKHRRKGETLECLGGEVKHRYSVFRKAKGEGEVKRRHAGEVNTQIFSLEEKMTGGTPEVRSDKILALLTFDISLLTFYI